MRATVVDISAAWSCPRCPYKHAPDAICPAPGVWLVLELCPACNERTGLYCRTHRDRHPPKGDAHHPPLPDAPEAQTEHLRRYESKES